MVSVKAPITDRTLGIALDSSNKFADVRKKAHDEYIERAKRRKKDKVTPVSKYKIGDHVVFGASYGGTPKVLVEIVDFENLRGGTFCYYGIVLKASTKAFSDRIGRLTCTTRWGCSVINIPPDSVKWLEAP